MRWLFLIMLALNLSYIAWEMLDASKKDAWVDVSPLPDVPTILLVNETEHEGVLTTVSPITEVGGKQPVADMVEDSEQLATERGNGETESIPLQPVGVALANQLVAQTQVSFVDSEKETKNEGAVQESGAQIKTPDACFTLGPFRELDTLRALTRNIKEYVEEVGFRSRDEKESSLFWVYLPSLGNRAQAEKVGEQLKAKKIKDFYIIRGSDKKNGISLGQFRNKGGAYRLAKKVTSLGFTVEVEPIFKTYTLYWLDYRLIDGRSIPKTVTAEYLKGEISRLSRLCGNLSSEIL